MEFFKDALPYLPPNWETHDYQNRIYILVELSEDSTEYHEIKAFFQKSSHNTDIKEIKRIQHPFAYLRYKLKMEFLEKWSEVIPTERREIEAIRDEDLQKFIEYNCDHRRTTYALSSHKNFIIKKYVCLFPERDTNWYPEYLVIV